MSITTLSYNPSMSYIPVEYPEIEELIEDDDSDSETATENEKLTKDAIALNWALNAEALQQVLYTRLGNRIFDEYSIEESEYLEVKIAYAKFGPPDIASNDPENLISYEEFQNTYHFEEKQNSNIIQAYSSLYSKEQRKKAKKTMNLILDLIKKQNPEAKTFKVAFIFLVYQLGSTDQCGLIPIIRVLREEGDPEDNAWYIDQENRAYDTWKEFLEGNRLPKMRICYPKNGYYSVNENGYSIFMPEESVIVGFGMTPAAKISRKILRTLDWTTSGILIGTLGIAVASALSAPISVPILTTAAIGSGIAAFYGASRSGATLVDRKLHAQSINVTNAEARSCWIGIGSSIFSVSFSSASMLVHRVVAISHSIGASTVYTVNGLHTGALIFSGAGVANQSHHIGKKIYKRQRVTAFEVMELALSTFLFSNSLISFKTANIQLMDQQQQQLQPQTAPTATQTAAPTAAQTAAPTAAPSSTHVAAPTATQTAAPSATQAAAPTAAQIAAPTAAQTAAPTATQTAAPASTATQAQTATTQHVPVNIDNSQQQNQSQSQTSASGNTSGQHGFVDKLVNNVNADNVSDKHSKIIRTLNAIQNPNEFFAKSLEITKQVNRLAGSVVNKDKSKISEKEAHSDLVASSSENLTLPSCDSSKTLSDKDISIDSSKSVSTKVYTSKIEEILLNDYKFLAMIKLENEGIEEIGRLETRIRMSFYTIHTKDFTPELVKMCILISKHLGINYDYEFFDLCSSMKRIFEDYFQPVLKSPLLELEREIVNQLQNVDSKIYKDLMEELSLKFFTKLNAENKFHFEDADTARGSYEAYSNSMLEIDEKPLGPKIFMQKINHLFTETLPYDKDLIEYKDHWWSRSVYISEEWRGVLHESIEEPKEQIVIEFEFVKEEKVSSALNLRFQKIFRGKKEESEKEEELEEKVYIDEEKEEKGSISQFKKFFSRKNNQEEEEQEKLCIKENGENDRKMTEEKGEDENSIVENHDLSTEVTYSSQKFKLKKFLRANKKNQSIENEPKEAELTEEIDIEIKQESKQDSSPSTSALKKIFRRKKIDNKITEETEESELAEQEEEKNEQTKAEDDLKEVKLQTIFRGKKEESEKEEELEEKVYIDEEKGSISQLKKFFSRKNNQEKVQEKLCIKENEENDRKVTEENGEDESSIVEGHDLSTEVTYSSQKFNLKKFLRANKKNQSTENELKEAELTEEIDIEIKNEPKQDSSSSTSALKKIFRRKKIDNKITEEAEEPKLAEQVEEEKNEQTKAEDELKEVKFQTIFRGKKEESEKEEELEEKVYIDEEKGSISQLKKFFSRKNNQEKVQEKLCIKENEENDRKVTEENGEDENSIVENQDLSTEVTYSSQKFKLKKFLRANKKNQSTENEPKEVELTEESNIEIKQESKQDSSPSTSSLKKIFRRKKIDNKITEEAEESELAEVEEEKNEQTKAEDELKEVSILRFKRIFQRKNEEDEQGSKEEAKNEPKLSKEDFASPPFGFKKIFQRSKEQKMNETIFLNEN